MLERLLPAHTARFKRNHRRDIALGDVNFNAHTDRLDCHAGDHLAGQIRVVKTGSVGNCFVLSQLQMLTAEMHLDVGREIGEMHAPGTADFQVLCMQMRGKAIGRQPATPCIWLRQGGPDFFGCAGEDAVQLDGAATGMLGALLMRYFLSVIENLRVAGY